MKTQIRSLLTLTCAASVGLLIIGSLGSSAQAGYIVTLQQVGSNTVATGSGAIDLTGLTFDFTSNTVAGIWPHMGFISVGPTTVPSTDQYSGITGPASFGIGAFENAFDGSGDLVAIFGSGSALVVPHGYVSGSPLSDSATYAGTFGNIGITPGTYVWTWGNGENQNFTLVAEVPEPSTLTQLAVAAAGLGLIAYRRRR
jgi:hypothetical protein